MSDEIDFQEAPETEAIDFQEAPSEAKKPWLDAGPLSIPKSPTEVNWLQALKDRWNKKYPGSMSVADSPLLTVSGIPGEALSVGAVGGLQRAATSPIPGKIADTLNATGHLKGIAAKLLPQIEKNIPEAAAPLVDLGTGLAGRKAAYSNWYTGIPQGVSDIARGGEYLQKGLAKGLDATQPILKAAIARGTDAGLAARQFMPQAAMADEPSASRGVVRPPTVSAPNQAMTDSGDRPKQVVFSKIQGSQFEEPLKLAASRGEDSFGSTYYMLYQSYPEFRKLLGGEEK